MFYIIGSSKSNTSVIYTGLFKIFDNKVNVAELNKQAADLNKKTPPATLNQQIILDDTIKSETQQIIKETGITKENSPFKKSTGLVDAQEKLKKLKGK